MHSHKLIQKVISNAKYKPIFLMTFLYDVVVLIKKKLTFSAYFKV